MSAEYLISFLYAIVLAGTPLLFGTLGEILTEKSGNLNLGVEGMMCMGAVMGFMAGYRTNSAALAVLCAFAAGMVGALIYAFLTVTLKANQNVTGLTLTIFGAGFAEFVGEGMINSSPTGSANLSEELKDIFGELHIPFLSDIPYVGDMFFKYNMFVYIAIAMALILGVYLYHTRQGLNLRAVGENPAAADAGGVNVTLYKYVHILTGGGICGLGGAYVSIVTCGGTWTPNCVNGLGWIAVALVIFVSWSPYRAIFGSILFGALSVLRLYISGLTGLEISLPTPIFSMLPFIVTAVVLVIGSVRMSREHAQPKGCGVNYFREDR